MNAAVLEATRLWTLAVPTVSAFVGSAVRDFQTRDDVLQNTAVAVLESFPRYDPAQPFVAWALGVARNQVRLHLRARVRDRHAFDTDTLDALVAAFADTTDTDRRFDHLAGCVEQLDPKARELCRLRYDDGLKPAAIAERLGGTANAVAKALQRVRDRLRECIERKNAAEGAP